MLLPKGARVRESIESGSEWIVGGSDSARSGMICQRVVDAERTTRQVIEFLRASN